jgi:hypothetical protein
LRARALLLTSRRSGSQLRGHRLLAIVDRVRAVLTADFGTGFDAVLLLYGEFNTFRPADAERLLVRARESLKRPGHLVLEVQQEDQVRRLGTASPTWYVSKRGLFADEPHLCLIDGAWNDSARVSAQRFTVYHAGSEKPDTYVCTTQAYTDSALDALLGSAGFTSVQRRVSRADEKADAGDGLVMITASL